MTKITKADEYFLIQKTLTTPAMSKLFDMGPTILRALENKFTDLVAYYLPLHIKNLEPECLDAIQTKIQELNRKELLKLRLKRRRDDLIDTGFVKDHEVGAAKHDADGRAENSCKKR